MKQNQAIYHGLQTKCIGILQKQCPAAGSWFNRVFPVQEGIGSFVVYDIEIVSFAGIVSQPEVGYDGIDLAIILYKSTGRKFGAEHVKQFQLPDMPEVILFAFFKI